MDCVVILLNSLLLEQPSLGGDVYNATSASQTYVGVDFATASEELTWLDAEMYCQDHYGTHLATVLNPSDQAELVALLLEMDTESTFSLLVWIGWRNWDTADIDVWLPCNATNCVQRDWPCAASDEANNASWHNKEATIGDPNKCGLLYTTSSGKWQDSDCTLKKDLVCNGNEGAYRGF